MQTSIECFDKWFVNILERLYEVKEAGFIILIVSLVLLE